MTKPRGPITVFVDTTSAVLTLPDGRAVALSRFEF